MVVPMFTATPSPEQEAAYLSILEAPLVEADLRTAPNPGDTKRKGWLKKIEKAVGHRHIFLDPDIGIRTPTRMLKGVGSRQFVNINEIIDLLACFPNRMLLCFDQSLSRGAEREDREEKLEYLRVKKTKAAYFTSHASFLAASKNEKVIDEWIAGILKIGIHHERLQYPVRLLLPE